jgi:hypothetical protein
MAFGMVVSALLLPAEMRHYLIDFPAHPGVRAVAVLVLAGASLALMTPGVLAVLLLAGRHTTGAALVSGIGYAWAGAVAIWFAIDMLVRRATGNAATYYLQFATQPDAMRWAGNRAGLVALFGDEAPWLGTQLALALGLAALAALVVRRRADGRLPRRLAVLWVALLAAGPLFQRLTSESRAFMRLNEGLPFAWNAGFAASTDLVAATEDKARDIFQRYYDQLDRLPLAPVDVPVRTQPPPNIVIVVVDGLRRDVFTPAIMPRLFSWSARGARFDRHFAAANGSEWGTFGLLYGLTPFRYMSIVGSRTPPTLLSTLWRWGYEAHFVTTASAVNWLFTGKFLGPDFFTVHTHGQGAEGWENDRDSVATARDLLTSGGPPKLVFIWLGATHWVYSSPGSNREWSVDFVPPPRDPAMEKRQRLWARTYAHAARYVDDLVGEWVEGLDPARNLVVVTADHGEGLYDDGSHGHGSRLSSAQIAVPFVIVGGGVAPGRVVDVPTGNFDLPATLLDVLGAPREAVHGTLGEPLLSADAKPRPYTVVYRPAPDGAVSFKESMVIATRDIPREVAFVSDHLRFGIRLHASSPDVSRFGLMDDMGAITGEPITPAEARTFLTWFEDLMARSAGTPSNGDATARR